MSPTGATNIWLYKKFANVSTKTRLYKMSTKYPLMDQIIQVNTKYQPNGPLEQNVT